MVTTHGTMRSAVDTDLDLDALATDVVEHELGPRGSLGVYPASDPDLDILSMFACLEGGIFLQEGP